MALLPVAGRLNAAPKYNVPVFHAGFGHLDRYRIGSVRLLKVRVALPRKASVLTSRQVRHPELGWLRIVRAVFCFQTLGVVLNGVSHFSQSPLEYQ